MAQKADGQLLIIAGPTASGKSKVASRIANIRNAIIINADSKQVYNEIPIITAQPNIKHRDIYYMYGYISIHAHYSVKIWLDDIIPRIKAAWHNNQIAILVGGTGMYINTLLHGLLYKTTIDYHYRNTLKHQLKSLGNIEFHKLLSVKGVNVDTIHPNDSYRLIKAAENSSSRKITFQKHPQNIFKDVHFYILIPERDRLYKNINDRFVQMLNSGVIDEIRALKNVFHNNMPALSACGIIEILQYLNHSTSLSLATSKATQNIRRYAKRQITWFRNQSQNATFFESQDLLLQSFLHL